MSEVYNPESDRLKELASLELEAGQLAKKCDAAANESERNILEKQLKEIEDRIAVLKRKLKP